MYRNHARPTDGLAQMTLRETGRTAGGDVRGGGPNLHAPAQLPATMTSVRVQLRGQDGAGSVCYAIDFSPVATPSPTRFRARR